jgi:alkylated DNA repair dioxygenase AlkB
MEEERNDRHSPTFRSVFPQEPLPNEDFGYCLIQGAFEPKRISPSEEEGEKESSDNIYWTKDGLEKALHDFFSSGNAPQPDALDTVTVLEDASSPPFTKARLRYTNPLSALLVVQECRAKKASPQYLFADIADGTQWQFTSRQLQVTPLTTCPMLSGDCTWKRSNPPKFRRLICRPGEPIELLQEERQSTRFVFVSGLVDSAKFSSPDLEASWWNNPRFVSEAIRNQANQFDKSGMGVEVFVSIKKNKATHSCHVGMRSPEDAKSLILGLQGKTVEWTLDWNSHYTSIKSDKLFLDYAAITQRSMNKAKEKEVDEDGNPVKGEKCRSECTSSTKSVHVPGLVILPDYISEDEEAVLMAALTGPTAPWAPSQTNFSKSGAVKRRVQHYGYVFDYETADVLRDRSKPGADCPPLPGLPAKAMEEDTQENKSAELTLKELQSCSQKCVEEGRGWDTLACLVERTSRMEFNVGNDDSDTVTSSTIKKFPDINQLTVNSYEPGEGIGSHVDTPSAFSDGLISVSLNGGTVMEFRKQNSDVKTKKLVYLPRRSLVLMSGPARFEWEHMIVTRMTDTHEGVVIPRTLRVSLTMRTAIDLAGCPMPKVTTIDFPPTWGPQSYKQENPDPTATGKRALITPALERDNVHAVYDAIAAQWHHTRGKRGVLWPGATQFLTELPAGSIVADVGCGDGELMEWIYFHRNHNAI